MTQLNTMAPATTPSDATPEVTPKAIAGATSGAMTETTFQTERFGVLTLPAAQQLQFSSPILGFETETRFALFNDPEDPESPFQWLQSLTTPELAFIVTNPVWFGLAYSFVLPDSVVTALNIQDPQAVQIVTLVTVPADAPETMTTNLMAPLIINTANQTALQLVMHDAPPEFGIRVRLIPDEALAAPTTVAEG
jgi:flagellar assembly factor FliW